MRAVRIEEFGGPEVLQVCDDVPVPQPADGEVLIRVTRAGINFADTHQRHNQYVAKAELPLTPGSEVAGIREDTGERVIALCGTGGYAEYATAPGALTFPIPDGVSDETALALLVQGLTAWHLHRTAAQLRPGETVVVHSAAGGTGSLTLQLAKPMGAGRVIASASNDEKRALALELGADAAIDSAPEGLGERLKEANLGREVDVVYEMAGGQSFDESFAVLAPFGRIVAYGIATREQNEIRTGKLLRTSRSVVGFWFNHCLEHPAMVDEALTDLFARAARGELKVVVGGTYPLEQAAEAQVAMAERRTSGKLLLDPQA
jgi:NADPH2:quinone reductase